MTTFRSMNTEVTVLVPDVDESHEAALADGVANVFAESEARFSRFRADSELAMLNRAAGPCVVSRPMIDALERADAHWGRTRGLFDPTIGAALSALGYDRSFVAGALDRAERGTPPCEGRWRDVRFDRATRTVSRPAGVQLDFGGFMKGLTVDRAARTMQGVFAIDAGGDAVLSGDGPRGDGWLVDIEDPFDASRVLLTIRVCARAVATSASNRRRWHAGDLEAHHLIDPRTALPSRADLAQVSALAPTAEEADVLAKTAFLLGARDARTWLSAQNDVAAVMVRLDGAIEIVGDLEVSDA